MKFHSSGNWNGISPGDIDSDHGIIVFKSARPVKFDHEE
jgi:hypothetical protein